jgi:hypothetical protein
MSCGDRVSDHPSFLPGSAKLKEDSTGPQWISFFFLSSRACRRIQKEYTNGTDPSDGTARQAHGGRRQDEDCESRLGQGPPRAPRRTRPSSNTRPMKRPRPRRTTPNAFGNLMQRLTRLSDRKRSPGTTSRDSHRLSACRPPTRRWTVRVSASGHRRNSGPS